MKSKTLILIWISLTVGILNAYPSASGDPLTTFAMKVKSDYSVNTFHETQNEKGMIFTPLIDTTESDFSAYQLRKQWVLDGLKNVGLSGRGKHVLPKAVARLEANPFDQVALNYITNVLDNSGQSMFDFPGVALALCRYWDSFSPAQIAALKSDLERLAIESEGGFLGHGTENHATMMWSSAYLFGQMFPDANWANGMTSQNLMADMKERLRKTFRNVYKKGYTEYLSTTYEVVMNFPVEILLEYAIDAEMRDIAKAFMLYKWSLLSLNNFEGNILAPYARMNTQQDHLPTENYVAATTYYNWLMWGWGPATGNVKLSDFINYSEASFTIYAALARVTPDEIFFKLANDKTSAFTLRSSAPTFGHYGTGVPHMMMRKVYRDKLFGIGTGNFRWVPGGDYADHDNNGFNIVWSSPDRFNYIGCYHPYWYSDGEVSDRTPDTWYKGNISPFQQTAHHENTVITLFDIPEKDPWMETPSAEKWIWRDGHAENLIQRGMFRYPKSVSEKLEKEGWIFLREGKVYIGIKPLKSYYVQTGLTGRGLDGFNIVKSDHAQTGFIFELGTEDEFENFLSFQETLLENKITVNWENLTVSYINSQKDTLEIQYKPGLNLVEENPVPAHWSTPGHTGMAESIPDVSINGIPETPYREWPMIESPFINMNSSILELNALDEKIIVDWNDVYPKIGNNYYTVLVKCLDSISENPIEGLEVTLRGTSYITNNQGIITIPNVLDTYYKLNLPDNRFKIVGNDIIEVHSDTTIEISVYKTPQLTLKVINQTSGANIYRASLKLNGLSYFTNTSGLATIGEIQTGNISVSATHNDYFTLIDSVVFTKDTIITLSLTPKRASVTFSVSDNISPLSGVKVSMPASQFTNSNGNTYFYSQPARVNYIFSAEKSGYSMVKDTFYLERDTTIEILLNTITSVYNMDFPGILISPNPFQSFLKIDTKEQSMLYLYDVTGRLRYNSKLEKGMNTVFIDDIEKGGYILKIIVGDEVYNKMVFKVM